MYALHEHVRRYKHTSSTVKCQHGTVITDALYRLGVLRLYIVGEMANEAKLSKF